MSPARTIASRGSRAFHRPRAAPPAADPDGGKSGSSRRSGCDDRSSEARRLSLGAATFATTRALLSVVSAPRTATLRLDDPVPARPVIPLAAALALLAAPPAVHAAWTAPQPFAGPGAGQIFAAGNRHGSEALIWKVDSKRVVRLPMQTGLASSIRARIRLPAGALGRAATISSKNEIVTRPQIGVDENGNATAVWAQAGRHIRIMAAFHPHGKPFGKPVELGRSGAFNGALPSIAVGRFGDAAVAWNDGRHIAVRRYPGNAQCSPARHFACYRPAVHLRAGADHAVTIGPLGSAYVAWAAYVRTGDDVHTQLRLVVIRRSGGRSTEHFVSRSTHGSVSQPSLAVRPDGTADLAWRASLPAGGEQNERAPILVAASEPDAIVAQPRAVSTLPGDDPAVAMSRQGEAIVSWNQFNSTPQNPDGEEVAYAVRPAGATAFGPATTISAPGDRAAGQSLAVDASGNAVLVYVAAPAIGPAPNGAVGMTHLRPAGGVFGPAVAFPGDATNGLRVFAAGPKVSAFSGGTAGVAISDRVP
jgi:hypothetical protein